MSVNKSINTSIMMRMLIDTNSIRERAIRHSILQEAWNEEDDTVSEWNKSFGLSFVWTLH